jgi:hypothetical protein
VTATNDQQPVKALGTDGPHPTLRIGVGVGCLPGCHQHFGALRAEYVVEPTAELPVPVADEKRTGRPCSLSTTRRARTVLLACRTVRSESCATVSLRALRGGVRLASRRYAAHDGTVGVSSGAEDHLAWP